MRRTIYAIALILSVFLGTSGAALMATQKGPYYANRPTFSSPGGYEYYDLTSSSFKAHNSSEILAQIAKDNDDPILAPQKILSAGNFTSTLIAGPLGVFALKNGTNWRIVNSQNSISFVGNSASTECPACTNFAYSNMRYYVYVYDSASLPSNPVITFEVSVTPPESGLRYKTGDNSRLYIGTFRNSGTIIDRFTYRNGIYSMGAAPVLVFSTFPAPTSYTTFNLAGTTPTTSGSYIISPNAKFVLGRIEYQYTTTGGVSYISADCNSEQIAATSSNTVYNRQIVQFTVIPGSAPCYFAGTNNSQVYLYIFGFTE